MLHRWAIHSGFSSIIFSAVIVLVNGVFLNQTKDPTILKMKWWDVKASVAVFYIQHTVWLCASHPG